MSDAGCPLPSNWEEYGVNPVDIVGPFTLQQLLFIFSISCAGITTLISIFLIIKHLHRYTEPKQQRQIVRIVFFPVLFATLSALSILNYDAAKYMQPLIALYEPFALAALFLLYIEHVAPDENARSAFFATLEYRRPRRKFPPTTKYTVVPGGSQRWYRVSFIIVFLFVNVSTIMTIVELVTEATDHYCEESWSPKYAHIWVEVITTVFLVSAVVTVVTFYIRFHKEPEFSIHKPGLKILSFKLIVFLKFLQSIIFAILLGQIETSQKMTGYDLKYGIPAALVAFEQILFAVFFHYVFRSREYHETAKKNLIAPRMGTFRAAANVFNPTDLLVGMFTAVKLLFGAFRSSAGNPQSGFEARGQRPEHGRSAYLEPMSQQPYSGSTPARTQPTDITVTGAQETGYSNAYTGGGYAPPAYPPNAAHGWYADAGDEGLGMNLYAYVGAGSRDSSVDATSTRQMV